MLESTSHRRVASAVASLARAGFAALLDLTSERRCGACDALLQGRALLCPPCADTVVREPLCGWPQRGSSDAAYACYGGAMADTIRRFKYQRRPDLGEPLGQLLVQLVTAAATGDRWQLLMPVPLHPRRLADRGYNQAVLLARPLARRLGLRLAPDLLVRCVDTPPQAGLSGQARRVNLEEAFAVRRSRRVAGRAVLLVDDVTTTGATLAACRRSLLAVGAVRIDAVVLARSEPRS